MMQAKRKSLSDLTKAAGSVRVQPLATVDAASAQARASNDDGAIDKKKSRDGTKPVTAFFAEEVRTQLKLLSVEQRRSMESMMAEALNDLFAKYGKPEIAPRK